MRRPRVEWMTRADDTILEFLLNDPNNAIVAPPGVIADNIEYTNSTVKDRVRILRDEGLLDYFDQDRGVYEITEKGRAYLRGDLDASDLERYKDA